MPKDHFSDPDFYALPRNAQLIILGKEDPEFVKLSPGAQNKVLDQAKIEFDNAQKQLNPDSLDPKKSGVVDRFAEGAGVQLNPQMNDVAPGFQTGSIIQDLAKLPEYVGHRLEQGGAYYSGEKGDPTSGPISRALKAGAMALPITGDIGDKLEEGNVAGASGILASLLAPSIAKGVNKIAPKIAGNRSAAIFNPRLSNKGTEIFTEAERLGKELLPGGELADVSGFSPRAFAEGLEAKTNVLGEKARDAQRANSVFAKAAGNVVPPDNQALRNLDDLVTKGQIRNPRLGTKAEPFKESQRLEDLALSEKENILNLFQGPETKPVMSQFDPNVQIAPAPKRIEAPLDLEQSIPVRQALQREAARNKYYADGDSALAKVKGKAASGMRAEERRISAQNQFDKPSSMNLPDLAEANDLYRLSEDALEAYLAGQGYAMPIDAGQQVAVGALSVNKPYAMGRGALNYIKTHPGVNLGVARGASKLGALSGAAQLPLELQRYLMLLNQPEVLSSRE